MALLVADNCQVTRFEYCSMIRANCCKSLLDTWTASDSSSCRPVDPLSMVQHLCGVPVWGPNTPQIAIYTPSRLNCAETPHQDIDRNIGRDTYTLEYMGRPRWCGAMEPHSRIVPVSQVRRCCQCNPGTGGLLDTRAKHSPLRIDTDSTILDWACQNSRSPPRQY